MGLLEQDLQSGPPEGRDAASAAKRRTVIAFGDIAGYSVLMVVDEAGTHERWITLLDTLIIPAATARAGKVVQVMGDGVLAEFAAAGAAVDWADAVHAGLRDAMEHSRADAKPPIVMRIAIHAGEVTQTGSNLFGDAVNLAARLQDQAEPGGTIISAEAAQGLPPGLLLRPMGELALKNVSRTVEAFAVGPPPRDVLLPAAPPKRGGRPSIAVLPLRDLGGADEHFADGLIEDIILSLSGLREVEVIARASTLRWRGRTPDPREVGWALGVRYVLDGTVRRAGGRVRVTTVLSDAETGESVWAEATNGTDGDLFAVQDALVGRVIAGIAPQVRGDVLSRAMRKRPESFTAYEHMLRGLAIFDRLERTTWPQAREAFGAAMRADANYAMPVAWAARWHSFSIGQGWAEDHAADAAAALALAEQAIALDPRNALALSTYGHLRSFLLRESEKSLVLFDRALDACPNLSLGWILSSATYSYLGQGGEALDRAERGLRLSPLDPHRYQHLFFLGLAHYVAGNFEEAVRYGLQAQRENALYTATPKLLAAAYAALGRDSAAAAAAAMLREREPGFSLDRYFDGRQPFTDGAMTERYGADLRRAFGAGSGR